MKTNNIASGIYGNPIDPITHEPVIVEEHEHFYVCKKCGQAVDMRDLGQVFHHEQLSHEQIKIDS